MPFVVPDPDGNANFIKYKRYGSMEPAKQVQNLLQFSQNTVFSDAVPCGCETLDNLVSTTIWNFAVPIFKSSISQRFGISHDCVTIIFTCKGCNTVDIPLTIESGPGNSFVQRWGKYVKYELLDDGFEEQFNYSDLGQILEKFKASPEYNVLTYNCKDFAFNLYDFLYNYNPNRLKYVNSILVYVRHGQSLTSLQMTAHFAKHLLLLPYRHFVYWTWYKRNVLRTILINESNPAKFIERLKRAHAKKVKLKSTMEIKVFGYHSIMKKFRCTGPVDMDSAQTDPSYILNKLYAIQNSLQDSRVERENAGENYNGGKFGTFKFLDFMLVLSLQIVFYFYVGFLILFGYDVNSDLKRIFEITRIWEDVALGLKFIFLHYYDKDSRVLPQHVNNTRIHIYPQKSL